VSARRALICDSAQRRQRQCERERRAAACAVRDATQTKPAREKRENAPAGNCEARGVGTTRIAPLVDRPILRVVRQGEPIRAGECLGNLQVKPRFTSTPSICLRMGVHAPYKVAASVSPEQYEIVNVRTSRGLSRPIVLKIHTERGAIVAPNGAAASAGCSPEAGSLPRVKAAPAERPSSEGWIEHHRVRSALLSEVVSANRASRVQWRSLTDPEHRITECKVWRRRSAWN
jgi:hypothetical protein